MTREDFIPTERWGAELYGDPCAGCAYDWSTTAEEAVRIVDRLPAQFRQLLDRYNGVERHAELAWGPVGYTCHVADNLRAWAEGLGAGLRSSAAVPVPGYDPDLLAEARRYHRITAEAALWSLERAVCAWCGVVPAALAHDVVLWHSARGEQRARDVVRNNAHDATHHLWDVWRILHAKP